MMPVTWRERRIGSSRGATTTDAMPARARARARSIGPSTTAAGARFRARRIMAASIGDHPRSRNGGRARRGYARPPVTLRRLTRPQLVLLGLVATGAALRFATLETQSFWIDEGYTVHLLRGSLSGLVHGIPRTEETPPLYYALAWLWTRPFGTAEAGVRSLSALFGTATIPVAYLLARRLASQRAGLVAAALTAFNPLLVWYSQEARAYALLVLLSGLSILLFLRALDSGSRRTLVQWAIVSALTLTPHYFA